MAADSDSPTDSDPPAGFGQPASSDLGPGADIFASLREEYRGKPLGKSTVAGEPLLQFRRWFDEAVEVAEPLANAMTLATVDRDGQPSARVVLLKSYDVRGFVFFTNYRSRKSDELAENPRAAVVFFWPRLLRQVRIEGEIERIAEEDSDAYFATRPRASNLSAMASPQSQTIPDRRWLEGRVESLHRHWSERPVERPSDWGGYRLVPACFEFWQGREDRLHDRLCYHRQSISHWRIERLAP